MWEVAEGNWACETDTHQAHSGGEPIVISTSVNTTSRT